MVSGGTCDAVLVMDVSLSPWFLFFDPLPHVGRGRVCRRFESKVNMVLNVHRKHKAYQGRGEGGMEVCVVGGGGEIIYLSLHCHHQNYFCIKMGNDESHFNVSLIVRDKVTR